MTSPSKAALREQIRARMKSISAAQRVVQSGQACELLKKQSVWEKAKVIFFYAPLPNELDIWPLVSEALMANKIVTLPGFEPEANSYIARQIENLETDLQRGQFGILEPKPSCHEVLLNRLDFTLVPGVGFDLMGRRLGRGKGFYDRLLGQISGTTCGVGFDEQVVEAIPTEPHDVCLNCILTPTRWHEVNADARFE